MHLPEPELPKLHFVHSGRFTYERTYSAKRELMPSRHMGSVKHDVKTAGRIDNADRVGGITFKSEFLQTWPELNLYRAVRQKSESEDGRFELIFTPRPRRTSRAEAAPSAASGCAAALGDEQLEQLRGIQEICDPAAGTYHYSTLSQVQHKALAFFGLEPAKMHTED